MVISLRGGGHRQAQHSDRVQKVSVNLEALPPPPICKRKLLMDNLDFQHELEITPPPPGNEKFSIATWTSNLDFRFGKGGSPPPPPEMKTSHGQLGLPKFQHGRQIWQGQIGFPRSQPMNTSH